MKFFLFFAIGICLHYAPIVIKGAAYGLTLWYQDVVPCLFPFMILTSLLSKHILKGGRFLAIFCGFICGYPLGAKMAADLYKKNQLSASEMQLIAGFCNLSSPMFLVGYAKLGNMTYIIYLTAIFFLLIGYGYLYWRGELIHSYTKNEELPTYHFEEIALDCCRILLTIGIYIIIFSIISALITEIFHSNLFLSALMEITTGTYAVMQTNNLALTAGTCVFGGLCGVAQTKSVMNGCPFSILKYLFCKILHAIVVMFILHEIFDTHELLRCEAAFAILQTFEICKFTM